MNSAGHEFNCICCKWNFLSFYSFQKLEIQTVRLQDRLDDVEEELRSREQCARAAEKQELEPRMPHLIAPINKRKEEREDEDEDDPKQN